MKNILIICLLATITLASSCNKLKHVKFNADYDTEFTVNKKDLNGTDTIFAREITTNIETLVKDNNTNTDLVQSVRIKKLSLDIIAPEPQTFSFCDDIRIYISTENTAEIEVASKTHVSHNGKQLDLDLKDVELKNYLISDVIRIKVISTNREQIMENITVKAKFQFAFEANLLAL